MPLSIHDLGQQRAWPEADFEALVGAAAADLRARLSQPRGARVAGLARNGVELLALMLACFRVGAVFVPLNWRLSRDELAALLKDCEASLVYTQQEFRPLLRDIAIPCPALEAGFAPRADGVPGLEDDSALAILLYTSGTSGRPKGVMLTRANLKASSEAFCRVADVRPESGLLCDAPMFHVIGLVAICHTAVMVGARLLLSPTFSAEATVLRIADQRLLITHYFTVPQAAQMILQSPNCTAEAFGRLRGLFIGGAPLSHELARAWQRRGVQIINGYGSSEAGTVIHMPLDQPEIQAAKIGSVGRPVPGMEVSLRGADGNPVADGDVGELWLRGASITSGYWRQPSETRQAFCDGWFRSGDLGRCDADGYYFLVGRLKDMYISGGENIYPAEVERVIAQILGVREVAVVGQPDPTWGEVGEAYVVSAPNARLSGEDIIRWVRDRIAAYKVPKRVHFLDALPRTASGKIRTADLRRS